MRKEYPPARAELVAGELRSLIAAARSPLERAAFMFLLDTALRRSEMLAVREADVDWRAGTVVVRNGKGGRSRLVAPGRITMRALGRLRNGDGLLWHLSKSGLKRMLDGLAERAGMPPGAVYPHRLRVTRICDLLTQGTDAIMVGAVAGHSLEMVRYYSRSIEQRRALEVQRRKSLVDRLAS